MGYIQTVNGRIDAEEVTGADSHTHLIAYATPELIEKDPDLLLDSVEALEEDLTVFKSLGGNLIAEMTTIDYGSDVTRLKEVSEKYGIHIIASAAFNKGIYNRRYLEYYAQDVIESRLYEDCVNGIVNGIKPGILKIGTSLNEITPWEEKGLRAVAHVHQKTGIPISTHTQNGTMGIEQAQMFKEEGVPLDHVIICHLDQCDDYTVHEELLSSGAYLSYDSVAKPKYKTRERAIEFIIKGIQKGFGEQLLVGNDFARRSCYRGYGGTIGYTSLFHDFKEELKAEMINQGFSLTEAEQAVKNIYTENPKRAFSIRDINP